MKKRILTIIMCALLIICALPLSSCTKEKMPESTIGQVDYIIRHRLEAVGCKVETSIDENAGTVEVTVKSDKYGEINPFTAENYVNIAGRQGKFAAFMLNYDKSYFEIFSANEVEEVEIKKSGTKNTITLKLNDSIKEKYIDAATTSIELGEPIYILLDNEIIAAPQLKAVPEENTLTVTDNFDDAKARKLDAMITYGAMPCLLEFGESSFDHDGHLKFTLKLVEEPAKTEAEVATEVEAEAEVEAETEAEVATEVEAEAEVEAETEVEVETEVEAEAEAEEAETETEEVVETETEIEAE